MHYSFSLPIPHSPLHKKALEIFTLSKNISQFLVCDLSGIDKKGEEHPDIYVTGDIVQKSVSLFPEIIKAEQKIYSEEKQRHAETLILNTQLLYKKCERLEKSVPNGKEFIALLRKEIRRFRKMQHHWALTL